MKLLLMLSACVLAGADPATESNPPAESLRVLSYNIHHGEGSDGVLDLDRIVRVIQACEPQIVCLQEIDQHLPRTQSRDFPMLLAEKLGMEVRFGANYHFEGGHYGNATLTSLPVLKSENFSLPLFEDREPRGCLKTVVRWQEAELAVYNTHLGLEPEERLQQARKLLDLVQPGPALLCGDFNESLDAPAVELLLERFKNATAGAVQPVVTSPAHAPRRQIDFILLSTELEPVASRIIQSPASAVASDHLPVCVELRRVSAR